MKQHNATLTSPSRWGVMTSVFAFSGIHTNPNTETHGNGTFLSYPPRTCFQKSVFSGSENAGSVWTVGWNAQDLCVFTKKMFLCGRGLILQRSITTHTYKKVLSRSCLWWAWTSEVSCNSWCANAQLSWQVFITESGSVSGLVIFHQREGWIILEQPHAPHRDHTHQHFSQ